MASGAQMTEETKRPKSELGGVVVIDFGGQYTQLIARRVREQQVFSAVLPCTTSIADIRKYEPSGLILSGGPSSAYDADAPTCDHAVLALGVPVLGICYGMQLMGHHLGGKVENSQRREYGASLLKVAPAARTGGEKADLFHGLPEVLDIWNSHGDKLTKLPKGFVAAAAALQAA